MNLLSWIILAAVAAWFIAAIAHMVKHRGSCSCGQKNSACCGDCASCKTCGKYRC